MRLQIPNPKSEIRNPSLRSANKASGVALVITLILLSVITFMAITFLVVSSSEKGSVGTLIDQNQASLAADTAFERAKADLLANIVAFTNQFDVRPMVSQNYINPFGFVPGNTSFTNVNYDYTSSGAALSPADQLQNLANLVFEPRAPVYVTNIYGKSNEFRFYHDLNRNGRFDPSGYLVVTNSNNQPVLDAAGNPVYEYFTGDPQWVGILEKPAFGPGLVSPDLAPVGFPHSAANKFIGRYAYFVVPASQTLDVNYIHNHTKAGVTDPNLRSDAYYRNEGVGSWEINMAAFLRDLNTNTYAWGGSYFYELNPSQSSSGPAFEDALAMLRYRYNNRWSSLSNFVSLYGGAKAAIFANDRIDGNSDGFLLTGFTLPADKDDATLPWAGSDNVNHFFTTQDFFDRNKIQLPNQTWTFVDRLSTVGTNSSSYDRYTGYRLFSQLGTDSAREPEKLHLNYVNVDANGTILPDAQTNFISWTAPQFFTNAAIRLLVNAGYSVGSGFPSVLVTNNFGFTNLHIPIYPTNFYTPSLHRMLQLAANIYDATTNRGASYPYFPSVFQPVFEVVSTGATNNWFITGFREVEGTNVLSATIHDPAVNNAANQSLTGNDMVYGIPLVIGAKQGFPNFNEFAMQTYMYVSRLLEFRRPTLSAEVNETNQMYVVAITNVFGVEAWNSYKTAYPRTLDLTVVADMTAHMTNEFGTALVSNLVTRFPASGSLAFPGNSWGGWTDASYAQTSFRIPLDPATNGFYFLTNATYRQTPPGLVALTHEFERNSGFAVPHWWLILKSRLRFVLIDRTAGRIVDYVNLDNASEPLDITAKLTEGKNCTTDPIDAENPAALWCTNRLNDSTDPRVPTYGIINQINVGLNGAADWKSVQMDSSYSDVYSAIDGFRFNLKGWGVLFPNQDQGKTFYRSNIFYAPLAPFRPIFIHSTWQANDPLVHYTINDLLDLDRNNAARSIDFQSHNPPVENIGYINQRYEPWGGNPSAGSTSPTATDIRAKDALITRSDDWVFPTNKFANVGWLGRVHRGTPWQTIYLKPGGLATNIWQNWTGNGYVVTNIGQFVPTVLAVHTNGSGYTGVVYDSAFTQPTNDYAIFDVFTTAFNDNATRGQMSVNQTNLAAWSAILSGVLVVTNTTANAYTFIEPAGAYDPTNPPPVVQIVNGINKTRLSFPNGAFNRVGDILAVPELTADFSQSPIRRSPFLGNNTAANPVSDAVYEWIPMQILSLLKGGEQPRFIIYAYGQALKPAERSIVTSGPFFGMVTNYQITAEMTTRTVVRVEGAPTNTHVVVENFNILPPD